MRPIDDLREKINLWKKSTTDTALMSVLHDVLKQIDLAIYEMDHQEAESPWHRVEEPPKEYGNYLAVVNGEVMEVTYSDMSIRDDWNWSTCDADGFVWIRSESVTHWMPLPEPPKEEE